MSKETSTMLKGVAILMMLFLHLFNSNNLPSGAQPLLFVDGIPLVNILSRASSPVSFFLILSGYGHACLYSKGRTTLRLQVPRLLKLYITYWLSLLIFVPIGCYINPMKYPGSILDIIGNVTSWSSSYNSETWFLFPYMLLSLTAQWIFKVVDKVGNWKSVAVFGFVYLVCAYTISRYIAVGKSYGSVFTHFIVYFELMFAFVIGGVVYRISQNTEITHAWLRGKDLRVGLLLILAIAIRCVFTTSAVDTIYATAFILLFMQLNISGHTRRFLTLMGGYSMPMWLIHSYFCYHLFRDFIYGFRFLPLIFLVLLTISLAFAIPLNKVSQWICKKLAL